MSLWRAKYRWLQNKNIEYPLFKLVNKIAWKHIKVLSNKRPHSVEYNYTNPQQLQVSNVRNGRLKFEHLNFQTLLLPFDANVCGRVFATLQSRNDTLFWCQNKHSLLQKSSLQKPRRSSRRIFGINYTWIELGIKLLAWVHTFLFHTYLCDRSPLD